jgi:hypothetical protein
MAKLEKDIKVFFQNHQINFKKLRVNQMMPPVKNAVRKIKIRIKGKLKNSSRLL